MADNFTANPGSGGDTFAADDVGGVKIPYSKLDIGTDGNSSPVTPANPMPVTASTALPVSAASLPLPTGAATEATLAGVAALLPALGTTIPNNNVSAPPTRLVGEDIWNCSFSDVGASVLATEFTLLNSGTGFGYSQAGGALLITTGTNTNQDWLARSATTWQGALALRYSTVLSQRIANQNFTVLLADLIGETLSCTINSAVSISVTKTAHGYTSQNVGQFMMIGGIVGAAGVPGRYAIASIPDANTINFTVAGWPASGSCTLDLFGHSYVRNLYTSTTATNSSFDCQRRGWADTAVTATINTTASPGHIAQIHCDGRNTYLADSLRASSTTPNVTLRANRMENLPDDNLSLYVFLWSYNGTVAPASTTTWTISFCAVEKFANLPVYVQGQRMQGAAAAAPVSVIGTATVSGTVTANIGTGSIAAGTNAIGDVGVQYRANATGAATPLSVMSPATPAATTVKAGAGRLLGCVLQNSAASVRSVKLWNLLVGSVTLGTTSATFEWDIPAGGLLAFNIEGGIAFGTGITYAVTGAKGLTDNTAITANDVSGALLYA